MLKLIKINPLSLFSLANEKFLENNYKIFEFLFSNFVNSQTNELEKGEKNYELIENQKIIENLIEVII